MVRMGANPAVEPPATWAADLAAQLREVSRLTGIGIFDHDHCAETIYWSPEQRRNYGWTDDEPVTLAKFLDHVDEADRAAIAAAVTRAHDPAGDGRFDVVHRIRRRDGQLRWLATRSQTFFADGRPVRTIGAVSDVTSQRFMQGPQVSDEAVRLWAILDHSLNEIYLFDSVTLRFAYVNEGSLRNLGYSREHIHTLTPVDLKPDYDEASFRQLLEPLLAGRVAKQTFETVHLRRDGSRYPVEVHLQLVDYDGSRMFLAVINDITERRRLDQLLRQRDRAIATSLHPIAITRIEGDIAYVNPAFVRQWGYDHVDEIVGRPRFEFAEQADVAQAVEALSRDGVWEGEMTCIRKDGSRFVAQGAANVVKDEAGQVTHLMGSFVDVTERNAAAIALRASLEEKEVLLKEIHHRVKNNLQVVSSLLSLQAQRSSAPPEAIDLLRSTQGRVRAMALLHESLYRHANVARVPLKPYLDAICNQLTRAYHSATTPRIVLSVEDLDLSIDQAMPCGLLVNELVVNALKHAYADPGGVIEVVGRRLDDGRVELMVRDRGVGLPGSLDVTRATSLGLRLVTQLAEQLGSSLDLDRTGGLTVTVRFEPIP